MLSILNLHCTFYSCVHYIWIHIRCSKLFKGLKCAAPSMVLCTIKNPWSYSKRIGHRPDFWFHSVAILPWSNIHYSHRGYTGPNGSVASAVTRISVWPDVSLCHRGCACKVLQTVKMECVVMLWTCTKNKHSQMHWIKVLCSPDFDFCFCRDIAIKPWYAESDLNRYSITHSLTTCTE